MKLIGPGLSRHRNTQARGMAKRRIEVRGLDLKLVDHVRAWHNRGAPVRAVGRSAIDRPFVSAYVARLIVSRPTAHLALHEKLRGARYLDSRRHPRQGHQIVANHWKIHHFAVGHVAPRADTGGIEHRRFRRNRHRLGRRADIEHDIDLRLFADAQDDPGTQRFLKPCTFHDHGVSSRQQQWHFVVAAVVRGQLSGVGGVGIRDDHARPRDARPLRIGHRTRDVPASILST